MKKVYGEKSYEALLRVLIGILVLGLVGLVGYHVGLRQQVIIVLRDVERS